jgi:phytoene synthase
LSFAVSQSITRQSASNLALALWLLPRDKRACMTALYAFCRQVDDVADNASLPLAERRARLCAWRADVRAACENGPPQFQVTRELQPVIARFGLPFGYFDELIQGVEMDLEVDRYGTYGQLELYCYRVASVVGLLSIEVFGYQNPACRDYALHLGKALQFTNILRDVGADAQNGRIYLPLDELSRFQVTPEEILRGEYSARFRALAGSVAQRAREFYRSARQSLPAEDRRTMIAAELMASVYWQLLHKLQARQFDVFGRGLTKISRGQKLLLVLSAWWRGRRGTFVPSYGVC